MKSLPAAATVTLALAAALSHAAADESPYIDDRSDAASVVRSLYSAINRHEYARAWDYYGEAKPAKDFDAFVKGYENTGKVEVEIGTASEEGAAGSIYFSLPVAIRATAADGGSQVFAGCYTLRQVNAQIQEPPFNPIHIEKGALKPSSADLADALPESCGDGPPPPGKDAALEQARTAFATAYASQCDAQAPDGAPAGTPEANTIRYKAGDAAENEPEREVRLFRFFCTMGAYSETAVYYVSDEDGVRQLQFAVPELDIRYENGDSQGKVEAVGIIGFRTEDRLVNSAYDEVAHTIASHDKWRGVGDASTSGIYLFRNGHFSLVQYDVDASYDGEIDPQTVLDYNTPP